jgi:PAS domain S-box-containing protein
MEYGDLWRLLLAAWIPLNFLRCTLNNLTQMDLRVPPPQEQLFEPILEAAPYGQIVFDSSGVILLANARAQRMFGYTHAELLGSQVEMLLPERYRSAHVALRASFAASPGMRAMGEGRDLTARHRDGSEFPVEIGLNQVPSAEGVRILAAIADISQRRRMELQLRQANASLEEFTYVVSHDLKSPVRGIAELTKWIGEELGEQAPPGVRRNLGRVESRVKRLQQMIDDLLAFARAGLTTGEAVDIEPRALVDGAIEIHGVPLGFELVLDITAKPFRGAKVPLETVVRNLLDNALKHHDRAVGRIQISAAEDDLHFLFSISDDGPGIPLVAHDRVFKMFQTAASSGSAGSGIGLALTKRLVEAHGGRITLESAQGERGATFRVWWPRLPVLA